MKNHGFAKTFGILLIVLLGFIAPALTYGSGGEEKTGDTTSDTADYKEPRQLKKLIEEEKKPYILVDVRTEGEYSGGYIPTAINLPVQIIKENPPEAPGDQLVIVYCRSGNRSALAKKILSDLGYSRVVDFGGINSWPYDLVEP